MQLRTRLTVHFIVVVAPIIIASFLLIYLSSSTYRKQEFYQRLKNKAITTAEFLIKVEQVDSSLLKLIDKTQKDQLFNENISIYNYLNKEIYTNNDTIQFKVTKNQLDKIRLNGKVEYLEGQFEVLGITYNDKYNRFVVIAGAVDKFGLSKLSNLRNTLIALFFVIILLIAFIGRLYAARALLPISTLAKETELFSPFKLSVRLNKSKHDDEIGILINNFNTLLGRIEDSFKIQKLFFASASHELKNPLMSITTQLEVSLAKNREKEEYRKTMISVLEDIRDLNKLTIQLMELARISYDSKDIPFKIIRIDSVLWDSIEVLTNTTSYYNCKYKIVNLPSDEKGLNILANETLLKMAFLNIAENACKFSNDNSVAVTLDCIRDEIIISFSDNGPGINDHEKLLVFEPFYRGKATTETKGHGIGLAIVNQIVILHNANITIQNNVDKGTIVQITFHAHSNNIISKV